MEIFNPFKRRKRDNIVYTTADNIEEGIEEASRMLNGGYNVVGGEDMSDGENKIWDELDEVVKSDDDLETRRKELDRLYSKLQELFPERYPATSQKFSDQFDDDLRRLLRR